MAEPYSLENLLTYQEPVASPIMIDPKTGLPGRIIAESPEEAKLIEKKLSPTGTTPNVKTLNPKAVVPGSNRQTNEMDFLANWGLDKEKLKSLLNEQQLSVDQQNQLANEARRIPPDINLKPMAGFLGTMMKGGENLAASMPEARSEMDRATQLAKLQAMVSEGKKNATDQAIDLLKASLNKRSLDIQAQNDRFAKRQDLTMFNVARKEQAGLVKDATEFRQNLFNAEDAITPDKNGEVSVARLNQALSSFSRLMGEKGVLTDYDIARQFTPTINSYLANLQMRFGVNPGMDAKIPAKDAGAIKAALDTAKKAFADTYAMKKDVFKNTYFENPGSPYAGSAWSPQMISELEKPLELIQKNDKNQTPQGGLNIDQNAIDAELKRRGL